MGRLKLKSVQFSFGLMSVNLVNFAAYFVTGNTVHTMVGMIGVFIQCVILVLPGRY